MKTNGLERVDQLNTLYIIGSSRRKKERWRRASWLEAVVGPKSQTNTRWTWMDEEKVEWKKR